MSKDITALIIMDGFGIAPNQHRNAILEAGTPELDKLCARFPHTTIGASGMDVGLPDGQMGNSEVGHTEPRRGPHRLSGADPHHQGHSGRRVLQKARADLARSTPRVTTAATCT